jgi:hypothetical protein
MYTENPLYVNSCILVTILNLGIVEFDTIFLVSGVRCRVSGVRFQTSEAQSQLRIISILECKVLEQELHWQIPIKIAGISAQVSVTAFRNADT